MSLEKVLEEQIQRAMSEGKFDNLRGAGKPLNLDDYFATPEDIRVGYTMLKNHEFVPPEVELMKEIGILREKIENETVEAERKAIYLLNECSFSYNSRNKNLQSGKRKRQIMLQIKKAAVLGAGTMGAGIAAHLSNAGIPTLLLDIAPAVKKTRRIKTKSSNRCSKRRKSLKPAPFMLATTPNLISLGNFEDDLRK
jgi:hypothetical protein